MPSHRLRTEGVLIILKFPIRQHVDRIAGSSIKLAAESAERLLAGLFPTIAGPCDPQDYSSGILTTGGGDTAIVLYDTASGGIGLTEAAYRRMDDLIDHAIDRVQSCECERDAGCIRCVAHPHQESDASKSAAIALLQAIKTSLASGEGTTWNSDDDTSEFIDQPPQVECPECQANVPNESRFCLNCGHKLELAHV